MSEAKTSCGCGKAAGSCGAAAKPAAGAKSVQNGKGDAPRNISERFRSNYDSIRWAGGKARSRRGGVVFSKSY